MLDDIKIFKDMVVPGTAALFAVWIATRKFRKEQLWKEKYTAYQGVLRSLESIAHWASETQSNVYLFPSAGTKDIANEYALAQREVLRQVTIGPLLLSKDFCSMLEKFKDDFYTERHNSAEEWHENPQEEEFAWGAHAGRIYVIVDQYLSELIKLARDDLGANGLFKR
ncbi:hypothetical protein [Xanthomonas cannabis]|uniref:hypothetical protein n=1 Tax=Xanthomonas cannabis TaxID=1885674 RepID=UPI001300BFB8|nr:hypothetical protein [Xanthomonas cannabis]MCC8442850.1 hypothetical protein [Xanthomonas cannabis]